MEAKQVCGVCQAACPVCHPDEKRADSGPADSLERDKNVVLLGELVAQRTMNMNHRATRAEQGTGLKMDDLFVQSVPRDRYELLVDLAIEALRSRITGKLKPGRSIEG